MKITISALAVLVTANLAAASTASTRANTEATKIRSDYEKRVKAEIDSVYPEYDKTVDKAVAGYRLKRKALYSTCSALGSAGVKLGTKFETAIKVYESTIEDLTNLAVLKTNLTEIRDAYKIKIFTPATANVTALSNAISKYPKTSPCWDDNKESVEYRKEEAATIVEQNAQYYFDDEENVSMHLFALQSWLDSFTYEAGDLCNTNKTCKLTYYTEKESEILEAFLETRENMVNWFNHKIENGLAYFEDTLVYSTEQFESLVNSVKTCVDESKLL